MEFWFIFAILSAVSAGLFSFLLKTSAHMKHHLAQATMYTMISATVLAGIYALSVDVQRSSMAITIILAFANILAYATVAMSRVDA